MKRLYVDLVGFALFLLFAFFTLPASSQEYRALYSGVDQGSGLTGVNRNNLGFDTSSTNLTGAFGAHIGVVRLACTVACYVAIQPTGSASLHASTVTGMYVPANLPEYFKVSAGETIAVVGASAGNLIVHEMTR